LNEVNNSFPDMNYHAYHSLVLLNLKVRKLWFSAPSRVLIKEILWAMFCSQLLFIQGRYNFRIAMHKEEVILAYLDDVFFLGELDHVMSTFSSLCLLKLVFK
jgi:hypothetical protein